MDTIKIMTDYRSFPLWLINGKVENINPKELPISESLKQLLSDWQELYDHTLNLSEPANSGFPSENELKDFERKGLEIWSKMVKEIGDSYKIKYYSIDKGVLYNSFAEYNFKDGL